jgi:hypothetical protein
VFSISYYVVDSVGRKSSIGACTLTLDNQMAVDEGNARSKASITAFLSPTSTGNGGKSS